MVSVAENYKPRTRENAVVRAADPGLTSLESKFDNLTLFEVAFHSL